MCNGFRAVSRQFFKNKFLVCLLIFCLFALNFYFLYKYGATKQKIVVDPDDPNEIELRVYGKHKNQTNGCILPKLDPWDVSILLRMSKPKQTKVNKCKPTLEKLTELKNGILRVVDSNSNQNATECSYRCLYAVNDYEIKTGNWARVDNVNGSVPGCDLVEVGCKHHSNYSFIHTQIVESQFNVTTKIDSAKQPDVYWVILDSVSTSMFKRAFPKTERVLMNKFKAIEFPYLNKVELNSRPNAYAMFFGERYKYDWCKTPLDDKNFIGFDFQKAGYVTQQTEDWALGAINWSNCIGFKKKQVDHFMRPFWLKLDMGSKKYNSKLSWRMLNRSCREEHHYLFEQALQFANAYKTRPKFSFTWIVQLAHNFNSVLFKEDERFAEFFKKLHKKSKNAFVFFQSDHGIRFGKIRSIPTIGNIEDNNPFLFVSVPERLRKNKKLIKQIKWNARHLVSQFDVHATMLQISQFAHKWNKHTNFNQPTPPIQNRTLIGSSLFHQLKQPRTCENIGVPFEYCICSQQAKQLNDTALSLKVTQTLVDSMNKRLQKSEHKDSCHHLQISHNYPIQLEELNQKDLEGTRILRSKFQTTPGNGLYQGIIKLHANKKITLLTKDFYRLNSYAKQTKCIPEKFLRNYCVCKD